MATSANPDTGYGGKEQAFNDRTKLVLAFGTLLLIVLLIWGGGAFHDHLSSFGQIGMLVVAVYGIQQFLYQRKRDLELHEYEAYNSLDEKYCEFQVLAVQYPRLNVGEAAVRLPSLTLDERVQQVNLYGVLFSIFERAYLLLCGSPHPNLAMQWPAWESYIEGYFSRAECRRAWEMHRHFSGYDGAFADWIESHVYSRLASTPSTA